jgi:hypothetical protein
MSGHSKKGNNLILPKDVLARYDLGEIEAEDLQRGGWIGEGAVPWGCGQLAGWGGESDSGCTRPALSRGHSQADTERP